MAQRESFPTVIDVEQAAEFVPAIKDETYVKMLPRICALEIALEIALAPAVGAIAAGWLRGR